MEDSIFRELRNHADEAEMPDGHRSRFSGRLDKDLHLEKKLWNLQRITTYAAVASVVILIAVSFALYSWFDFSGTPKALFSGFSPELYETEMYYKSEINARISVINRMYKSNQNILADIEDLDESLKNIRTDLKMNPDDERLINMVFEIYEIKIELLDKVISLADVNQN
jgi:hypothetical protein